MSALARVDTIYSRRSTSCPRLSHHELHACEGEGDSTTWKETGTLPRKVFMTSSLKKLT